MTTTDDVSGLFFVDAEDYSKKQVEDLARRILPFAKMSRTGGVFIENNSLPPVLKLKLALACRFIANVLDEKISSNMTITELNVILPNESPKAISARMSDLSKKAGFTKKAGVGSFAIYPHKIGTIIEELENPKPAGHTSRRTTMKVKGGSRAKDSGATKDMQDLIDNGFFKEPKIVQEVLTQLKQETKYHDLRALDATIRNTFVGSKKTLKRLPNTKGGKAQWMYVVR